jgi:hypothetical protein
MGSLARRQTIYMINKKNVQHILPLEHGDLSCAIILLTEQTEILA